MTEPSQSVKVGLEELVRIITEQVAGQHRHQWAVLDVSYPSEPSGPIHPRLARTGDVTYVALKCHCGEPESVTMDGHWTMTQLMMEVARASHDDPQGSTASGQTESDSQPSGEYPPG